MYWLDYSRRKRAGLSTLSEGSWATVIVVWVIIVFATALGLDFASARYNLALRQDKPYVAARWSVVMCLLSSAGLLAFVDISRWMLVPELLGLYLGTCLGGFSERNKQARG